MNTQLNTPSDTHAYCTQGGIRIERTRACVEPERARAELAKALDARRGLLLSSSYEYPGRYKRYDWGFVDPPLAICASALSRELELRALNARGVPLLRACAAALARVPQLTALEQTDRCVRARVREPEQSFAEEERTRMASVFSALRALCALFHSPEDRLLGLYGVFGYDLVFQFEALQPKLAREAAQRDLVLYLPDAILLIDHEQTQAFRYEYELDFGAERTHGLPREHVLAQPAPHAARAPQPARAARPFRELVERARGAFARGDLFEATPSQRFEQPCAAPASRVFETLRRHNPAPYGFLANLGDGEVLVGASPEMYVRVSGQRVETCPIAGTIARGQDAFGDARQIVQLLNSEKDEAELTMCTDVDRNDKARICEPGSVRVIGRRQIELYSRLIHTVDHVEGRLRAGFDAIDAFLTHMWAVTVTGAPKLDAMQFIEDHEASPRGYYGGAIGVLRFDGSLDSGLVLRTVRLCEGRAQIRAGATLHFDSDPVAEEQESELKASALLGALREAAQPSGPQLQPSAARPAEPGLRVLLIDHRDSFVHTLADYFRQVGCDVSTVRYDRVREHYERIRPELVVLSPGPARPDDFGMRDCLRELAERAVPVFGVCLGLQGMVEFAGGELGQLPIPVHGKPSIITCADAPLFAGLARKLQVGRYHSLYAVAGKLPASMRVLAQTEDGCCMAVAHETLPWTAVQFHPESILSAERAHGLSLIQNVVTLARSYARQATCQPSNV